MFEALDPARVRIETIRRNRAHVESYLASIASFVQSAGPATPCAVFELSTSAIPEYTQALIDGRALAPDRAPTAHSALRAVLREYAKFALLWALGSLWRIARGRNAWRQLRAATAVLVGHVAIREGRAVAQDFHGFVDTELSSARVVTIAKRLPQTSWRAYLLGCRGAVIPSEACLRWRHLWRGLGATRRLNRALGENKGLARSAFERYALADMAGGHMMAGWLGAHAALAAIERCTPHATPVCLPMERHDWELLLTDALTRAGRTVWAVQNCSFSPFDLNMYAGLAGAPRYRNAIPQRLFVIADVWRPVFRELGIDCETTKLARHRFSGVSFTLQLRAADRVLYLGSINAEKVRRDLRALAQLPRLETIELRLHPSLTELPEAAGFARQRNFDAPYSACVYADTTMVFQLDTDRSRLVFLDHAGFPNQDPAAFFGDWPGKSLTCTGCESDAALLAQVLR